MIHILGKLPRQPAIAVSGGPDSMAVLDFISYKDPLVLHFNHGTEHADEAEQFVRDYCTEKNLLLRVGRACREKRSDESPEEYWRNIRYDFLYSELRLFGMFSNKVIDVITCHNLDDQVEQWLFSCLNGNPKLIPYRRDNVIRPFLTTTKAELESWCDRKGVPYLVDPGNKDYRYRRSFIRHELVPRSLEVNPGLYKVVAKKVRKEFEKLFDSSKECR
jgi:tRNA(Ile)-lysidine synthetase-like protein